MIKVIQPKLKALQDYVELFYVLNSSPTDNISYIAFPHTHNGLSFFKNTNIRQKDQAFFIRASNKKADLVHIELLGKYTQPMFVHYSGKIQEIAIVFKPLGINRFFSEPFSELAPLDTQRFKDPIWVNFASVLFEQPLLEQQIIKLEHFLVQQLRENDFDKMQAAIDHLASVEQEYTIQQTATLLNMTLKTFQRHFYKHFACTPSDYKRIAKFRHSLNIGLMQKEINNLSTIAYESYYYDQSYFVREYKKLTSLNPKVFFKNIRDQQNKQVVWYIK